MTRTGLIAIAAVGLLQAMPARADLNQLYSYGAWKVMGGAGPDQRQMCAIDSAGADGREFSIRQVAGEAGLELEMDKPSWNIPDNTRIDVVMEYNGYAKWPMHMTGAGQTMIVMVPAETAQRFEHDFRLGNQMKIYFPNGNEPSWTGNLTGTDAVFKAFNSCRAGLVPAAQPTTASTAPTQPYGTATTATQPFTPAAPPPDQAAAPPAPAAPPPAPAPAPH